MTERKPAGMSFETWIDVQIREAMDRGEFDNLPGAGKPIPDLDRPYDELWWIKQKLRREKLSFLPPTLALRKEAEDAAAAVAAAKSEAQVRQIMTDINEKIREATRKPTSGPPLNLMPFDVERVVADWRDAIRRRAAAAPVEPKVTEVVASTPPRWWHRLAGRRCTN
jgi:hypothetical protein